MMLPVTLVVFVLAIAAEAAQPNFVIFLADDQGWGDLSGNGNSNLSTPHIDSIGAEGAVLDRFYVCPVCSPTRAEFLTGRYHPRGGVHSTSTGGERLDLDEHTIAQTFQAAGYHTGAFGKWHNGMQAPYHPNSRGFDEYYGFCSGHWGNYFSPILEHNGKIVRGEGYITDDLTDHAIEFIEQNREQPFFCYVPYCTPHSPMQVPDRFYEKFATAPLKMHNRDPKRENEMHLRAALAMCENIDWNVGRVLQKLEQLELDENTVVIYFSDNGPNGVRWNGDMKGRKGSTDEGGVRVPFHIRWPAKIKPGTKVGQIAGAIDLLPTLADLAGIKVQAKQPLDGVSLKPLLLGSDRTWPDRMIFSHWRNRVSVRTQRFRLDNEGKLYDMPRDPGQRQDVADQHPQVAQRLRTAAKKWSAELLPGLTDDDRPFPVGHSVETHLPARDGVPHGNVKRSARAPNCSYFTNWTDVDDRITWDIDVAQSGTYEATIYYTCPKENLGAEMVLEFQDSQLKFQATEPHDPPATGAENDRAQRGSESYVKDFRPWTIGKLDLKQGRAPLTLRATRIPGSGAIEVRYVMLTRVTP